MRALVALGLALAATAAAAPSVARDCPDGAVLVLGDGGRPRACRPLPAPPAPSAGDDAVYRYAIALHHDAQVRRRLAQAGAPPDARLLDGARRQYGRAADAYGRFLDGCAPPAARYQVRFFRAEALYFAGRFAEAADAYEAVRDSADGDQYRVDAAYDAARAREEVVRAAQAAGAPSPPVPTPSTVRAPVAPLPMPAEVQRLLAAWDAYARVGGAPSRFAAKAAELELRWLHWRALGERIARLTPPPCADGELADALAPMAATVAAVDDSFGAREWLARLAACRPPPPAPSPMRAAERLFAEKKYEEAARAYLDLVDRDPDDRSGHDDLLLHNAAVALEQLGRFDAAARVYQRIVDEIGGRLAGEARFRVAVCREKAGDLAAAEAVFLEVGSDARFRGSRFRDDALFNAGVLAKRRGDRAEAARRFRIYQRRVSDGGGGRDARTR